MLLIDIGNTRIKWAQHDAQGLDALRAVPYANLDAQGLREQVLKSSTRPDRVLVANVGGPVIAQNLRDAIKEEWGIAPEFVVATASAAGVRNAYVAPEKLGVDRWLGVIAAHHGERSATCVVNVGTAMTIDAVAADGRHLGGVIVPGPDLMMGSLQQRTSDIALNARGGNEGVDLFADNTLAAIHQGSIFALASLIERAMQETQMALGAEPALLLTGGASIRIQPALRVPFRAVPDLVLQGLAILAAS